MYGHLKDPRYRPRLIDTHISEGLHVFGAVCIQGPKYCGKTWTGRSLSQSEISIMDPTRGFQNRETAELAPDLVLQGASPRLIDEWQEVPALWDAVRNEIDKTGKVSQFILTGSAVPRQEQPRHSGVGRIEKLRMRPMTLQESGDSNGKVSLCALFEGNAPFAKAPETTLESIISLLVRGGWPGSLQTPPALAQRLPRNYVETLMEDDLSRVDGVKREREKVSRLLHSLARNVEQATATKTIIRDMTADAKNAPLSADTVDDYLEALEKIFIIEKIHPWSPNLRSSIRINKRPKYHFVDPSLPAAILGAGNHMLFNDLNTLGFLFESLCIRDLLVYAQTMDANVFYYRDREGLEADAIIETSDGSWAAIEIKLGHNQADQAAKNLRAIERKLVSAGARPPAFLAVLEGVSSFAMTREDGVYVIPVTSLGA